MALSVCPDCGHEVSDRAVMCPGCGAPGTGIRVATRQMPVDDWVLSQLTTGSSRRQVVAELVSRGDLVKADADALVKRVEASALEQVGARSRFPTGVAIGIALIVLAFVFALLRASPGV